VLFLFVVFTYCLSKNVAIFLPKRKIFFFYCYAFDFFCIYVKREKEKMAKIRLKRAIFIDYGDIL